ncbi:Os11g0215700 [Oryza sativa Japonica Group]|uniref:Os11g0215700 protein n=1 Tax=Oryza sativa subsp. japonica TaxID=39947 RepID=A0A0P0Y094_ORYSJ|nr:Os11g0215700 [Oryza sativa Japonica Group]
MQGQRRRSRLLPPPVGGGGDGHVHAGPAAPLQAASSSSSSSSLSSAKDATPALNGSGGGLRAPAGLPLEPASEASRGRAREPLPSPSVGAADTRL